jgi:hypothetical protein
MFDSPDKGTVLKIETIPGNVAPRYEPKDWTELVPTGAVITEIGMKGGGPLVDIQLVDREGKKYFFMLSGSIVVGLGASVNGVANRPKNTGH